MGAAKFSAAKAAELSVTATANVTSRYNETFKLETMSAIFIIYNS
jgi:hypothetical protein